MMNLKHIFIKPTYVGMNAKFDNIAKAVEKFASLLIVFIHAFNFQRRAITQLKISSLEHSACMKHCLLFKSE